MASVFTVRNDKGQDFQVDAHKISEAEKDGFLPVVSNGKNEHRVAFADLNLATKDGYHPIGSGDQSDQPGLLGMVSNVAKKIDSYSGAPTRAAIGAIQDGNNPLSAFANQFGEDSSKAPTGQQIAEKAGVSGQEKIVRTAEEQKKFDELHNSGWAAAMKQTGQKYQDIKQVPSMGAGVLIDVAADPLNYIPVEGAAKFLMGGAGKAADALKGERQIVQAAQSQAARAGAEGVAKAGASISGGDLAVEQSGKLLDFKAPKSLDELRAWKPQGNPGELPGKGRLQEIEKIVPDLQTKPLKYHYDMMENPKAMKDLKLQFENLPTEDAKKIAAYNQGIVDESGSKVKSTIDSIAGSPPKTLSDAGDDLISTVKDKYNSEKEALGPVFQELQKNSRKASQAETMDMARAIGENTKLGKLMSVDENTGKIFLEKNAPRSGISDAEHGILSRVIDDMNDGMTFKEIQDTRNFLRKAIDPANPGASEEISKVRSILLGQLENMAGKHGESVGNTFRAYAKNERARESVEKVIGGKIESLDSMYAANPDRVVQKIFANPNYAKVVGDYVGPEKMQEMVAAYLNNGAKKAFDPATGFNPSALRSWIKSNSNFLNAHVDPQKAQRLSALADYGYYGKRFLDDVNPSGTAASLVNAIQPRSFTQKVMQKGILGAVESEVGSRVNAALDQRQAIKAINESLGGAAEAKAPRDYSGMAMKTAAEVPNVRKSGMLIQDLARDAKAAKVADQDQSPKKGKDKWAADGNEKLNQHSEDQLKSDLMNKKDSLLSDPKIRELLIQASDLKPGSKAMDGVMKKIKNRSAKGQE